MLKVQEVVTAEEYLQLQTSFETARQTFALVCPDAPESVIEDFLLEIGTNTKNMLQKYATATQEAFEENRKLKEQTDEFRHKVVRTKMAMNKQAEGVKLFERDVTDMMFNMKKYMS